MEEIINIIKERPIIIPRMLFNNYKKLNITEEELIVLIYIMNEGDKLIYNPEIIVKGLGLDKFRVMELINNLVEKQIINITVEKNDKSKTEEYINIDTLYNKVIVWCSWTSTRIQKNWCEFYFNEFVES